MRISNADNHKVYVISQTWANSGVCFSPEYTSCTRSYYYHKGVRVGSNNSNVWRLYTGSTTVSTGGDYARAHVYAKLDIPWRSDPYQGPTITYGTRY